MPAAGGATALTIGLPRALQAAIDAEIDALADGRLGEAAAALSRDYARGRPSAVADARQHAAYLATRFPATYAAVGATLQMVPETARSRIRTLLDLGAGPGTATCAVLEHCTGLESAVLVDRSAPLLAIASRLAAAAGETRGPSVTARVSDIGVREAWPRADVVTVAYALAELDAQARAALVASAWAAASHVLVIVEPGTPAGFAHVHAAREQALALGARVMAPCPHELACPMRADGADWCHFAVRVPRTRRHRQMKGGTLGYEDEKFACLVVAAAARPVADARVLRHPRIEKGRVGLTLCTPAGLARVQVTRRDDAYRAARKAGWGDAWPAAPDETDEED